MASLAQQLASLIRAGNVTQKFHYTSVESLTAIQVSKPSLPASTLQKRAAEGEGGRTPFQIALTCLTIVDLRMATTGRIVTALEVLCEIHWVSPR